MTSRPTALLDADGRLEIRARAYRLQVPRPDRPFARFEDAEGRHWADLALLAAVDTLGGPDEWWSIAEPSISEGPDGPLVTWAARSSRWPAARVVLDARPDHLRVRVEVDGTARVTDVHLLAGSTSARPAMGTGRFESARRFAALVGGGPDDPDRVVAPATEPSSVTVVGGSAAGRGRWFFTPGPLAFAVAQSPPADPRSAPPGPWLALGLDIPDEPSAGFTSFDHAPGEGSFGLRLAYEGHLVVGGSWRSPDVLLVPGAPDPYAAIRATVDRLEGWGRPRPPAHAEPPAWWLEPIFCGWGAQVADARAEGVRPAMLSEKPRYDRWLAYLEAHGVVPGTIVLDDAWQATYGRNEPHPDRWPDLTAWIAARHLRGQRVLLWFKAWDAAGLPPEWCVRNGAGTPVAADPTNPAYEAALRADVRRLLGRQGSGALDADGLKIDFTAMTPSGAGLVTHAERTTGSGPWGVALLRRLLAIVADEARRTKPDALLIAHTPNPAFGDLVSMIRLNDALRLDDPDPYVPVVAQLRHRAALSRAALPDTPIDTDDWCMPSRAEWRAWLEAKVEVGVPALYYVDRIDSSGEELTDDDLEAVARTWSTYRRARRRLRPS